jgi:hypothetical protein
MIVGILMFRWATTSSQALYIKRLFVVGGIQGFKTNRSLRATATTDGIVYYAKVSERFICEKQVATLH